LLHGHRTIPSACTRTSNVPPHITRRPSPWGYGKYPVTIEAYQRLQKQQTRYNFPPLKVRRFIAEDWEKQTIDVFDDPRFCHPHQPVIGLDVHDALRYCKALALVDSKLIVSLPTSDIWDIAAFGDHKLHRPEEFFDVQKRIHFNAESTSKCVGAVDRETVWGSPI
ncbi:SUMF1/EgtB/PvdO family nonheme iron enzyme, partial [Rhizobium mongolense]|uniref:SUMF1/EgtB/PvdO family nonheme iron enzyme n=1 Tax=Rhizobium mongolense TaxID=57676 RepID=UPI001613D3F3